MATPTNKETATGRVDMVIDGPHAALTITNPARKNAITLAMWQAIATQVRQADANPAVHLITLRGTDGTFVSGADISEFADNRQNPEKAKTYEAVNGQAFAALRNARTPTLALIEGFCFGGGVGLAAACDLRLASGTAKICIPPAKLGLAYPMEGLRDLVRLVGPGPAKRLFFTAEIIDAQTALHYGFVEQMAQAEAFDREADALIATLLSRAPLTQRAAKSAIAASFDDAMAGIAADDAKACFASQDYAEGAAAFLEKRKPTFTGT